MLSSSVLFRGAAMLKVVIPFMCLLIVYVISRDSSLPSRLSLLRMSNSIVNEKTYTANSIHRNTAYTANSISMNKTYTANSISRTPSSNKTDMIIHFKNQNYTNIIQDVNSTNMTFTDTLDSRPTVYVDSRPIVYVITPTYARPSQHPDLTRMSQALMLAGGRIHWLIIEDSTNTTQWVKDLAERTLPDSHSLLRCGPEAKHDAKYYKEISKKIWMSYSEKSPRGRGVPGRNCALQWLLDDNITEGVFYFADDDNAYDARIFNEIRDTKKVALFPTGSFHGVGVSTPVVVQGKVVSIMDIWMPRKWPLDMATFATSVSFWRQRGAPMLLNWVGFIETTFLQLLKVKWEDFEPKADNATKIWTWHTKTKQEHPDLSEVDKHIAKYPESNLPALKKWMQQYKKV